jgi:hypothetical protein
MHVLMGASLWILPRGFLDTPKKPIRKRRSELAQRTSAANRNISRKGAKAATELKFWTCHSWRLGASKSPFRFFDLAHEAQVSPVGNGCDQRDKVGQRIKEINP